MAELLTELLLSELDAYRSYCTTMFVASNLPT